MTKLEDLQTTCSPTWCPGCGNFGIWGALKNAALKKGWNSGNTVLVAGIGCHGNILNFIKITSFEGLHGRALPVATGIKLANHKLNVLIFAGDGDCLGEGGNHLIHTCRRNHDLTVLIHNNGLYSLTTGQTSPTSPYGFKTKSTPEGNLDEPVNILSLAIVSGATFVARGYAGDLPKLEELIIAASEHRGASIIEVLQPCVTFNKTFTHQFFQENCYWLENHNVQDKETALKKAWEFGPKQIPLGIFYQIEKPSYESQIPQISERPLVENPLERDFADLFKKYS